jgi:hypothetical protein
MICFGRFSSSTTSSIWQPEHMCAHAIFCLRSKVATLPAKQIRLVLADMLRAKPFGRTMEVLRKVFHRVDVGTCCALRVVATLEFIQHHLSKMVTVNLL